MTLIEAARATFRRLHRSPRTEEAYLRWIRDLIAFHGNRHPRELGAAEITAFLNHLAIERRTSASTQNQALCAIVFLYKRVLGLDIPTLDGLERAHRPEHLPPVLCRRDAFAVLDELVPPFRLIGEILYGSGLRLVECVSLRIKDIDKGRPQIMVRRGKGEVDLPQALRQKMPSAAKRFARARLLPHSSMVPHRHPPRKYSLRPPVNHRRHLPGAKLPPPSLQPHSAIGRPHHAIGAPHCATGRPRSAIGAPHCAIGAPHCAIGVPHCAIGRPHRPFGRPHRPFGRPHRPFGAPHRPFGRPHRPFGAPHRPFGRPHRPFGHPHRPFALLAPALPRSPTLPPGIRTPEGKRAKVPRRKIPSRASSSTSAPAPPHMNGGYSREKPARLADHAP